MVSVIPGIWEVQNGGSDSNGGGFNPNASALTNLVATSGTTNNPVISSATYNFAAGDKNSWLYIKSGTNWLPGWYKILSVASNAATIDATIGHAYTVSNVLPVGFNTVAGCVNSSYAGGATGTGGVDYTLGTPISLTNCSTSAANSTLLTTSATLAMIGNFIQITGGTNFTPGFYTINNAVAATSLTLGAVCASAAATLGTATIGGALATPGVMGAYLVGGGLNILNYNASPNVITSASANSTGGVLNNGATGFMIGYDVTRHINNTDANRPTWQIGTGVSSATMSTCRIIHKNIIHDGNGQTTSKGVADAVNGVCYNCDFINFTSNACNSAALFCKATGNSSGVFGSSASYCEAYANTATPFSGTNADNCLSYGNTGATTDGFSVPANGIFSNCVSYNNGRHGFLFTTQSVVTNCIAEGNTQFGYDANSANQFMINCADYNNTSGRTNSTVVTDINPISQSAGSYFVAAASNNFALNNTAGQGALCRAAGFPATFPTGTTADYGDVGAAQHQDSGGGGATVGYTSA